MANIDVKQLSEKLLAKDYPEKDVKRFLAYVDNAIREEASKDAEKKAVTKNNTDALYSLAVKYFNMGVTIDGVNAVVSGYNMVMVTYHGYKNAVLRAYPEAELDIQLVREGDTFSFAKESGSVVYTHSLADPFENEEKEIIGAYFVAKTKRGEFLETLNKTDFEKMKKASKMKYLWDSWASEFWLKSVIKRGCKRHFYDVVAEIDEQDNADFGIEEKVKASDNKKADIIAKAKANGNTPPSPAG